MVLCWQRYHLLSKFKDQLTTRSTTLKLLAILLTIGMFATTSHALTGGVKKGCGSEYKCKEKKGEEKISCRAERLTCQKGKMDARLTKLKSLSGKKLEKRKGKMTEKLTKRIAKSEERLAKAQSKLTELKNKAASTKATEKAAEKMQNRIKMKESHVQHVTDRIKMLKDYKSQIEALN